jgi:oxalate decarboxylase
MISRRFVLAAGAAGGVLPVAAGAEPARAAEASNPGPRNPPLMAENPDSFSPPQTDRGDLPSFKYSFAVAHNRQHQGGWARQVTMRDFPIAQSIAGVNMRLTAGGIRELHWHLPAEWAYMIYGNARITAVDQQGRKFVADVSEGDLWFFPSGIPHSIQGLHPDGAEFLLAFDDGKFSEFDTLLISDWLAHTPRGILAKNFSLPESAFADIPKDELYIFQSSVPGPLADDLRQSNAATVPDPYNFSLRSVPPLTPKGGTIRIADSSNFRASKTIATALVELQPGALRELHWHPNADEWQYWISGKGRVTVFSGRQGARTEDFQAGDVGYVKRASGHYVANTGDDVVRFLELFNSSYYADISLADWMGNTPKELIAAHLHLDQAALEALPKEKVLIAPA